VGVCEGGGRERGREGRGKGAGVCMQVGAAACLPHTSVQPATLQQPPSPSRQLFPFAATPQPVHRPSSPLRHPLLRLLHRPGPTAFGWRAHSPLFPFPPPVCPPPPPPPPPPHNKKKKKK
jgi:hypothetical protein